MPYQALVMSVRRALSAYRTAAADGRLDDVLFARETIARCLALFLGTGQTLETAWALITDQEDGDDVHDVLGATHFEMTAEPLLN